MKIRAIALGLVIIMAIAVFSSCAGTGISGVSYEGLKDSGLASDELMRLANTPGTFEQNDGFDFSGVSVSPYYSLKLGNADIPVYAALTYTDAVMRGTLHSFAVAYIKPGEAAEMSLTGNFGATDAVAFPRADVSCTVENGVVKCSLPGAGTYTFLVSKASISRDASDMTSPSQEYGFTLFLRELTDENAEIAELKKQYGDANVKVYEPGVHEVDWISFTEPGAVYLKRGAVLFANDLLDLTSADTAASAHDADLESGRHPFISVSGVDGFALKGGGIIDCTRLDWQERQAFSAAYCKNLVIDGPIFVNSGSWTLTVYDCDNVEIKNSAVFGYRTNSDGFVVANSRGVTVTNCFSRTGDDAFHVKGLGGSDTAVCKDVTFESCSAWAGKARCFGVTGEVFHPVSDVTFKNCSVIADDAIWDNDKVAALCVCEEVGGEKISNISFEDIDVFYTMGRPIGLCVYPTEGALSGVVMENITFKNVSYRALMKPQLKPNGDNSLSASFENVTANGETVTQQNLSSVTEVFPNASINVK